jgi:tetratricopeptide (TPR) repeat protein
MDATSQAAFKTQILSLEASLTKNPANFENWMQLGTDRKVIGDYQGAAQAWVYASELSPTDFVSPGNLADLYGYYLHDNALADTYYTAALHNGPSQDELYFNAASFYQQVENNLGKAVAVAQLGVKYNPGDQNLENLLTSLQTAASKTSAAN